MTSISSPYLLIVFLCFFIAMAWISKDILGYQEVKDVKKYLNAQEHKTKYLFVMTMFKSTIKYTKAVTRRHSPKTDVLKNFK